MRVTDHLRDRILECYSNRLGKADRLQQIEWDPTMEKLSQQVFEKILQVVALSTEDGRTSAKGD